MIIDSRISQAPPPPTQAGRGGAAQAASPAAETQAVSGGVARSPAEAKPTALNAEEVKRAVEFARQHIQQVNRDLHMSVDDDTGELVIKVVDQQSQKVIRQIPSEDVLTFIRKFSESIDPLKGMLLREKT